VVVNEGGLKLLQIKDNGCGIHPKDFPILCHRHTTSKIADDKDLKQIRTLGFRGEALCSISFVSRLKIVSMREGEQMGYKAEFRDSHMTADAPERCAAVQGTLITSEDMFYNVPNRLKALSSATQEFHLIYDIVAKYAVYCTGACPDCSPWNATAEAPGMGFLSHPVRTPLASSWSPSCIVALLPDRFRLHVCLGQPADVTQPPDSETALGKCGPRCQTVPERAAQFCLKSMPSVLCICGS
jgi:hypothetical protein